MTWTSCSPIRVVLVALALLAVSCSEKSSTPGASDPAAGIPEEGGFFSLEDESQPTAVRQVRESVFRIFVPNATTEYEIPLGNDKGAALKSAISVNEADPMIRTIMIKQIESCATKTKCKISHSFARGTAFLLGDRRTLWTAYHLLQNGLKTDGKLQLFIFNHKGELIFDSLTQAAQITDGGDARESAKDYARIQAAVDLGTPLKRAATFPTPGEAVYTVGFPSCSDCQGKDESRPGPEATGTDQRLSRGRPYNRFDLPLITTSVDAIHGNSGGPGLNAEGEVFGIVVQGGFWQFGPKRTRHSIFVVPPLWQD